jgi:DNA-binding response OmpR family regulator
MNTKSKVLLAEDDLSLGYVIKDNLADAGYEVVLCADGQAAIDKFSKESFDICLLDVMMPNKDGFAVAKKIRQQTDQVPILFITAKSLEEDRIHGFEVGADDYIVKPFSMQELLLRIDVFLRRTKKMHSEKSVGFQIGKMKFSFNDLKLSVGTNAYNMTQKEA